MLCELSNTGFIKISGNDAKKFLQGQLTCNVEAITTENSCMGAHCNPQGRIISLFYLFQFQQSYYLLMPLRMIPLAIKALKKYAVFFKTEISDASNEMLAAGCENMETKQIDMQHLVRIPLTSHSSRFIIAGETSAINKIIEKISEKMLLEQWKQLNIRDKIPELYPETSEKFLPHEINLIQLNAISFDKGCYTGQEIIARMHYRGKLKSQLYQAEVSSLTPPQPGADIYTTHDTELKACGMVVDACQDVYNDKYHVLIIANDLTEPLFLNQDRSMLTVQL